MSATTTCLGRGCLKRIAAGASRYCAEHQPKARPAKRCTHCGEQLSVPHKRECPTRKEATDV